MQSSLWKACTKHCVRQACACLCSEGNGMLILPLPRLDADPASLIAFLGLDCFSSLAHFAGHILHSRAVQNTCRLAANLHALAYFSGPADQRLAVANVLFGDATAGARAAPRDSTDSAIGAACDSLVQRGQQGAALALELLCLRALSAQLGTIIHQLVEACQPPHEMATPPGCNVPDTSRLPLHLDAERQLSGSEKQLPGTCAAKKARESNQDHVQHAKAVPAGSEEDDLKAQQGRKRARLEARDASDGVPATAQSAAREPDAVAQEAVKLVERLLNCAENPDAFGKSAGAYHSQDNICNR
ncbi:g7070 [Coccomyxa elongata]